VVQALLSGAKQGQNDLWWICAGEGISLGKDTPEGKAFATARQKAAEELQNFTFTARSARGGISRTRYEGFHDVAIHKRGKYDTLGDIVPRGFPALLTKQQPTLSKNASGRLELARWITSPENPLTARVFVNRVWQHHFGEGIVRTPNNFGKLGTAPTHPELLDWLAGSSFVRAGGSRIFTASSCIRRPINAALLPNQMPAEKIRNNGSFRTRTANGSPPKSFVIHCFV